MRPTIRTLGFSALLLLGVSACASAPLQVARLEPACPDHCGSIGPAAATDRLNSEDRRWATAGQARPFRGLSGKQSARNSAIDRILSGRSPGY